MWPQSSGLSRSFLSLPCPLKLHHRGRERPLKRMALQWRDLQRSRPLLCGCSARRLQASDVAPDESGRQASSELRLVERGSRSAGVAKDQDQRSLLLTPTPPPRARSFASNYKCIASSNKCLTGSNKKLVITSLIKFFLLLLAWHLLLLAWHLLLLVRHLLLLAWHLLLGLKSSKICATRYMVNPRRFSTLDGFQDGLCGSFSGQNLLP